MAVTDILFNTGESSILQLPAGQVFTPLYAEGTVYTRPAGVVLSDAGNSSTTFKTNLSNATSDAYKDSLILFVTGALKDQVKKISAFNATTDIITVGSAFTGTPAAGDKFVVLGF